MSTETAIQSFTYAEDGRLIKSTAADGTYTIWCYYPQEGGQTPDMRGLLHADWKDEMWSGEAKSDLLCLKAPATPKGLPRPVMAEYQYQDFAGKVQPISLTLYGYQKPGSNETAPLKVDTVVSLTGVVLKNHKDVYAGKEGIAWTFEKAEGRDFADVHCQTTLEGTTSKGTSTTVTERRYWGKERVRLITTQTREPDLKAGATVVKLRSRTSDQVTDDVELSTERLSLYSGLLSSRTQNGQQSRFQYDGLGRVVRETTWNSSSAQDELAERTDKRFADIETLYENIEGGVRLTTWDSTHLQTGRRRVLLDGLQQVVRVETQRVPGDDVSDANFCPVFEGGTGLDYLPGGLQRDASSSAQPDQRRDWFWAGTKEQQSTPASGVRSQLSQEQTLGDAQGARLILEQTHQNLNNGGVVQTHSSRLPSANTQPGVQHVNIEKTFDRQGRLTALKNSMPGAIDDAREFKIKYDDLDRPVVWTGPDGTQVKQVYGGIGNLVTRLSIVGGGKDDKEILVGEQTLEAQARVSSSTVGNRRYGFKYTTGGGSELELPDKTRLFSTVSEDGNTLSWKAETGTGAGKKLTTLATFTYDPLQAAVSAARALDTDNKKQITAAEQGSQWLTREQRQVASDQILSASFYRSLLGAEYVSQYPSDSQVITWRDRLDRRTRVQRDHLDYHYLYDAFGQCERTTVRDLRTGHTLAVAHEFDGFGQETFRRYWLDGKQVECYEQQWSASGQLIKKTVTRNDKVCLSETFTYDARDRLKSWSVDEASVNGPADATGKAIRSQAFVYDVLSSLQSCDTAYVDGSQQRQEHTYSPDNPTQRIKVVIVSTPAPDSKGATASPTRSEVKLTYDTNGYLTQDEQGRKLGYTPTGRLDSVTGKDGKLITRYTYDEQDRLASQWDEKAQQTRVLIYSADALCGEIWQDNTGKEIKRTRLDEEAGLAVQVITGNRQTTVFTFSDPQNGVATEYQPVDAVTFSPKSVCYTPWGESDDSAQGSLMSGLGYNGARRDPLTGCYHLGNGYRTYNPALRVFQQPDNASPFGNGGLNDYAYCSGDPVNLYDPDGHVMISRWGQEQMIRTLDQFVSDWTPKKTDEELEKENRSLVSTIIWAGVAILIAVTAVLLAIPTGGLSLVVAGALLVATVVSSGLTIASVALQNSNPELSAKLDWAATGIDVAMVAGSFKSVVSAGGRLMRWAGSKVGRVANRVQYLLRSEPKIGVRGLAGKVPPGNSVEGDVMGTKRGPAKYKIYAGSLTSDRLIVDSHGYFRAKKTDFLVAPNVHIKFYAQKYKVAQAQYANYSQSVKNGPMFGRNRPGFDPAKANKKIHDYNLFPLEDEWYLKSNFLTTSAYELPQSTPKEIAHRAKAIERQIDEAYSNFAQHNRIDILRITEGQTTFREVIEKILPQKGATYKTIEGFFCRGKYQPQSSRIGVRLAHYLKLDSWFRTS